MNYLNEDQNEQLKLDVTITDKETKRGLTSISTYSLKVVKEATARYDVESKVSTPSDAARIFREVLDMENLPEEVLAMITLNTKNKVTGVFEVHQGSLNSSIVHPRSIYSRALIHNAASIVVAHNHPSGDPSPSSEDINVTKRLFDSGKLIGIDLLDHIIIGEDGHFVSLKEKGII